MHKKFDRLKFVQILGGIVAVFPILALIGWARNRPLMESISGNGVEVQFQTAFIVIACGISMIFIARGLQGDLDLPYVVMPLLLLIILLDTAAMIGAYYFGLDIGIEFISPLDGRLVHVGGELPSLYTVALVFAYSICIMVNMMRLKFYRIIFISVGLFLSIINLIGMVCFFFKLPIVYTTFIQQSTAVSFGVVWWFFMLGLGLIIMGITHREINED